MYFNDIHILYYFLLLVIGGIIGQFVHYCSRCFIKEQKIFSKESFSKYKRIIIPNYIVIAITAIGYIFLLYKFGIGNTLDKNLDLVKYLMLLPMLECAFIVDMKEQIIPNRLNLLMFEIGLVFVFLHGFTNINIAANMLLGMFAGAGIFLLIAILGGLIAGKEAMGMGDVKLMGALGLYFGFQNIVLISVLSFVIGAIGSIVYMIACTKKVKEVFRYILKIIGIIPSLSKPGAKLTKEEQKELDKGYIPFGPFIVISTIITIFVPFSVLFNMLMEFFTLGMY